MPMGRFTKNTQRQPSAAPKIWMSSPPSSGPTAVDRPMVEPSSPNALPRSAPRKSCWIIPEICGISSPPPTPCTPRDPTSQPAPWAKPQAMEAAVNRTSPPRKAVRLPSASPTRPAGTRTRPKVRAYPETTQERADCEAASPFSIAGSATLTMETSSRDMKPTIRHTDRAFQRRGSGVYGCSSAVVPARPEAGSGCCAISASPAGAPRDPPSPTPSWSGHGPHVRDAPGAGPPGGRGVRGLPVRGRAQHTEHTSRYSNLTRVAAWENPPFRSCRAGPSNRFWTSPRPSASR